MQLSVPAISSLSAAQLAHSFVWLALAAGGFVMIEPAPYDALMMGLVLLLPLAGLTRMSAGIYFVLASWLLITCLTLVGAFFSIDIEMSVKHALVTAILVAGGTVLAAYVRQDPIPRVRLIFSGYVFAAMITAVAGIVGYFDIIPGSYDILTLYGRAKGFFKDPNVASAFMIPAVIYLLHGMLHRRFAGVVISAIQIAVLGLALLLCFSRGAWIGLILSGFIWAYLYFMTTRSIVGRFKLLTFGIVGFAMFVAGLFGAMQVKKVEELMSSRAAVVQSYDNHRFAGQARALSKIADNPLGIGALTFAYLKENKEGIHNVYLHMFLSAGWLGGLLYLLLIVATLVLGLKFCLIPTAWQSLLIVAYASFAGVAIEGLIVDTDHWRHFFVLMALLWGMMHYQSGRVPGRH